MVNFMSRCYCLLYHVYGLSSSHNQSILQLVPQSACFLFTGIIVNKNRRTHQIIDYAIVPVFGCEVKVTVNEIVTNAWLVGVVCFIVLK